MSLRKQQRYLTTKQRQKKMHIVRAHHVPNEIYTLLTQCILAWGTLKFYVNKRSKQIRRFGSIIAA